MIERSVRWDRSKNLSLRKNLWFLGCETSAKVNLLDAVILSEAKNLFFVACQPSA